MPPMTLAELKEKLADYDEVALIELLNIRSEQIVEAFSEVIEERFDQLEKDVDENE